MTKIIALLFAMGLIVFYLIVFSPTIRQGLLALLFFTILWVFLLIKTTLYIMEKFNIQRFKKLIQTILFISLSVVSGYSLSLLIAKHKPVEVDAFLSLEPPPVAVHTKIMPTELYPRGSINKVEYKYGVFLIPERFNPHISIKNGRLFFDIYKRWPEFEDSKYPKHQQRIINKVRIIFDVRRDRDYNVDMRQNSLELELKSGRYVANEVDLSLAGLAGYKRKKKTYFGVDLYKVLDESITSPTGDQIYTSCSNSVSSSDIRGGTCSYGFIIDRKLRVKIRFNRPLLKHFPLLHTKVEQLIDSILTKKDASYQYQKILK